jgi:hypothetical protein
MTPLTCPEVLDQIELHASDECDEPVHSAITQHLAACSSCAAAHQEAQQLVGLLTLRFREEAGLKRLQAKVEAEARRGRGAARILPLLHRWAAVAAMLLVTVGPFLALLLVSREGSRDLPGFTVAWQNQTQWRNNGKELASGQILAQRSTSAPLPAEVKTPAGVVSSADKEAEFFVEVQPGSAESKAPQVSVTVVRGKVKLTNAKGTIFGLPGETLWADAGQAPERQVEDLSRRFARHYQPIPIQVKPQVDASPLPLDLDKVANYKEVAKKLKLAAGTTLLKTNGFVVLPGNGKEDLVASYRTLASAGVPLVLTADTLLFFYQEQLDETLREIEERILFRDLGDLLRALLVELEQTKIPTGNKDFQEARKLALTYLAVGLKALEPKTPLPGSVDVAAVNDLVTRMKKYEADFVDYRPQGHYTRSKKLEQYFRAMTWFSEKPFLLQGKLPEARRQTLAAALITRALAQGKLPDQRKARAVWERLYTVISFYVGLGDDLGFQQYQAALKSLGGPALDVSVLANEEKLLAFKAELAQYQPPTLFSGVEPGEPVAGVGPQPLLHSLDSSRGFRLLGKRFVPDAYALGKLVYPAVGSATRKGMFTYVQTDSDRGIRGMPRGLDLMSLLGSQQARALLAQGNDDAYRASGKALSYDAALAGLRKEFSRIDTAGWNRNVYWSWLYSLKPLLADYGSGYPAFMTTAAYRTRTLDAALASWAKLRRGAVLYVSRSPPGQAEAVKTLPIFPDFRDKAALELKLPRVEAYVEPLPELYARLLAQARMARQGLDELKLLDKPAQKRLVRIEQFLEKILAIVAKELDNQALSEDDRSFLTGFAALAEQSGGVGEGLEHPGTVAVVAVHQNPYSKQVLYEAIGQVDLGVFVFPQPGGRLLLGAGPVLSYYELKRPAGQRLTEEQWRKLLSDTPGPARPAWVKSYLAGQTGSP